MNDDSRSDENVLRAVFRSVAEGVLVWSVPAGELVSCNDAAERILGISRSQMEGLTQHDPLWRWTREDGSSLPDAERASLFALRNSTVIGIRRPDGTQAWVRSSSMPVLESCDVAPYAVIMTLVDITEARETIAQLRVATRLAEATAGANVGAWEIDLTSGHAERNPRWAAILGYDPAEIEPTLTAFTERIHPDERTTCLAVMESGFRSGEPFIFECRALHRDRHWHWVQVRGKVAPATADRSSRRVAGVLVDIDARKRAEEALRATLLENERLVGELREALKSIKTLEGLLPICMHCKSIRDDRGAWSSIEAYVAQHAEVSFTHGICPACYLKHYREE